MMRESVVQTIYEVAGHSDAFDRLEDSLSGLSREDLGDALLECGVIPERFAHDSSEEKLWAKYCDILLSMSLSFLGVTSRVIRTRGDSADVFGETTKYSIVGDAKAFRLSRTAKNQKDFKVAALDDWRRDNTFACLVSSLYQYPSRHSQIYAQAEEKNVTLLSYIHLKFLLDHMPGVSLAPLWRVAGSLTPSRNARVYWRQVDDIVLEITGEEPERLKVYKEIEIDKTSEIGREGVKYWQSVIEDYQSLSQREAVRKLIEAEKIEQKIKTIRGTIDRLLRTF